VQTSPQQIGVEGKTFVTDDWEGYHRLIPESQLFTGKDLTVPIEQDNSNIRHFLARFRRRTKVVSKAVEMVDLSLRIYHHFHGSLDAFAAKAAVFQPIFGQDSLIVIDCLTIGNTAKHSFSSNSRNP
jgi:insertion element IS1 protein InsB